MDNSKKMNIVMISDIDWQSMYVTVKSIIETSKNVNEMCFHFLISDAFDISSEDIFRKLCGKSEVHFYRVEKWFSGLEVEQRERWIKFVTYYRLIIPQVIMEDKCLYMDTDTVICEDLKQLYEIDVKDYYVGGVSAIAYHTYDTTYSSSIGLQSNDDYINAGVLLMNLDSMRKHNVSDRMMKMIPECYPSQDQDIINIACYQHIKTLPYRYNVMTKYYNIDISCYKKCYDSLEIEDAWNRPNIIHYADSKKPWSSLECPLAYRWWSICRGSIVEEYFYHVLRDAVFNYIFSRRNERNYYEWRVMVLERIKCAPMALMYGAGKVANSCINELESLGINIKYVVQTKKDIRKEYKGIPIISVEELYSIPKNAAFVLAVSQKYELEIVKELNSKGFYNIIRLDDGKLKYNR